MAQNKKHHYVPRFYLKRFSNDAKSINLYNVPHNKKVLAANLKNQCYRNYFYGKDAEVESALGEVEGKAADLMRLIDKSRFPPPPVSEWHLILVVYILLQYGRTAYSADTLNEIYDKTWKHVYGPKAKTEGIDLSNVQVGIKDVGRYSIGLTAKHYPLLLDLEYRLLINSSGVEFVTSDNPVVFYNQLFTFRKFGSNTGLLSKGLEIFSPISPTDALLLFDPAVYGVGNNKSPIVNVTSPRDVYELNTLLICSADENIYFLDKELDVDALHRKAARFRRSRKSNLDVFPGRESKDEVHELIASSREDIRTNLTLSFLRLRTSARRWRDGFRKLPQQPAVVLRDRRTYDHWQDFSAKVDNGEYQPGDFFEYLKSKYEQS